MTGLLATLLAAALGVGAGPAGADAITLAVDATRAAQGIFHSHLVVPARPGLLSLSYPKWIPGEHAPTGPIEQLVSLRLAAGGQTLAWRRDVVDMFTFHVTVPAGASAVEADFDYLSPPDSYGGGYGEGPNATEHLLEVLWNQQVLAPAGVASDAVTVRARLRLPAGWSYDTALPIAARGGDEIEFAPVSLTTLVDSPVLAGDRLRTLPIVAGEAPVRLSVAADEAADLAVPQARLDALRRVVEEAQALFGAHHYRSYVWLLALTDAVDPNGLEHPESSDDRLPAKLWREPRLDLAELRILPHEYVHSWNGKYRRPDGLATGDYARPMNGELLWIYEGLTRYLSDVVLATRSGLRSPTETREYLAWIASALEDGRPGRTWRPLVDTAVSVQSLAGAPTAGRALRRPLDYYEESALIWLEADVLIRQGTHGARSLDDFCRRFFGPPSGPPALSPYRLDDVLAALGDVMRYAWGDFFRDRVYAVREHAPLGGLVGAGWKLAYGPEPNLFRAARQVSRKQVDWTDRVGLLLNLDGKVLDVLPGSPAFAAGVVAGEKVTAVDGAKWSPEALRDALQASPPAGGPLELVVERADHVTTVRVEHHGGASQPHLERLEKTPDLLSEIMAPRPQR